MKSLKRINLYTQIYQFCENQLQKLLRVTIFSWKSPKKMLELLKDIKNSAAAMVQCCVKSWKAMPASGDLEWPSKLATTIE